MNTLLILAFGFTLYLLLSKKKNRKHIYNVKQSYLILDKINSFKYDGQKINYLRKIDPFLFEEILLSAFEIKGNKIIRNKKYTGDGGSDGIVFIENQKTLIQAKRYTNYINPQHLKEFEKLVHKKNCNGLFIHTGKTGKETYKANFNSVEIISGDKLLKLLEKNPKQNNNN